MSQLCNQLATSQVCYNDGATVQTLVAHYEYGVDVAGNTILVATRYTDAAGVPFDASGGNVTVGACPIAPPDVEFEKLCDVQADGSVVEFSRRTIVLFDMGNPPVTQVADFELDKVTPYTVTGAVGSCGSSCAPATAQGVLTTWG